MAIHTIRPNGDHGPNEWVPYNGGDHYAEVNQVTTQPTIPNIYWFVNAAEADANDIEDFDMQTTTIAENIISVVLWIYVFSEQKKFDVDFYDGSSWQGYREIPLTDPDGEWFYYTFSDLNMTQTNVNNCRTRIRAADLGKFQYNTVYNIYCLLEEAPPSGPEGIEKVYGIESSAIAKKYGVNWSDITKIYGIT